MALKITGISTTKIRLEKTAERSTRALRRVHEMGADKLKEAADAMAPHKSGKLDTRAIKVKTRKSGRRVVREVVLDGRVAPYGRYMNDGADAGFVDYELGPGSKAKPGLGPGYEVGRKFMQRAKIWIEREWDIYGKANDAVRGAIVAQEIQGGIRRRLRTAVRRGLELYRRLFQ